MIVLKYIWLFVRNFILIPLVFAIIVGIVVGYITQDSNQGKANYEAAEMNRLQPTAKNYGKHRSELQEPDFDDISISIMISFLAAEIFIIAIIIYDLREKKKKEMENSKI